METGGCLSLCMQLAELLVYTPRGSWFYLFSPLLPSQSLVPMASPVATTCIHRTGKQHSKNQLGFANSVKTSLFSARSVLLCAQLPQLTDTGRRKMGGKTVFLSSSPDLSQNKVATTAASVDVAGLERSCSALLRQWMVFYISMPIPPFPALS